MNIKAPSTRVASPTGFNRHVLEYKPSTADNLSQADASWSLNKMATALYRDYPDMSRRVTFRTPITTEMPMLSVLTVQIAQTEEDTLALTAKSVSGEEASLGTLHLRMGDLSESSRITMRNLLSHLTEAWFNTLLGEVKRQRDTVPAAPARAEPAPEKPLNLRQRPAASPEIHTAAWFDDTFRGMESLPASLRQASEEIVKTYDIRGSADPGYIANVIAVELGIGDGEGHFEDRQPNLHDGLEEAAFRLARAYGSDFIPLETLPEIRATIAKAFKPVRPTP